MDFDTAKENIQPLRGGRRADRLETALGGDRDVLETERKEYEEAINSYSGLDPLENWYNYICWIEQSFPKSGSESGLDEAVSKCIQKFENDPRYRQDRRLVKLLIKFIDTQDNPHELYEQLYNSGMGTMVSDLYIAWSYYYDAAGDLKKAEAIFKKGINAGAQPFEELSYAHQAFTASVSQRLLYDDDHSRQQFQATMAEKRNALTTLRAYKKKHVGSIRVGSGAVKSETPGIVPVNENDNYNGQQRVNIRQDQGIAEDPIAATSGVKSIFDLTKKTENVHEASIWNKASKSSKNKLFSTKSQLGFEIMEDEARPPIKYTNNLYEKGVILPPNFVSKSMPQSSWNIPVVVEEPTAPNSIPRYDKFMLYPAPDIEISPEELKGYRWFKAREMSAPVVDQYTSLFENKYEYGIRIIPGFVRKNIRQDAVKYPLEYDLNNNGFQFPIKKMISPDGTTEYSQEELLALKFKRGEIKLVENDDFEETMLSDNMDITEIGDRRESVYYPPRKSIVPRKSILRKSIMPSVFEEEKQEMPAKMTETRVRFEEPIVEEVKEVVDEEKKNVLKRKLEIEEDEKKNDNSRSSSPESKRLSGGPADDLFKAPEPPKVSKPVFEIFDDESDETFSTKNFNLFIKSQSVSTPIGKKTVPRLVPLAPIEPQSEPQKSEIHESVTAGESIMHQNNLLKQLSTIVEVTETSNSTTKSSVSQISSEHDVESHSKLHIKSPPLDQPKPTTEPLSIPMLEVFKLPEEQTETTPFLRSIAYPKINNMSIKATPLKVKDPSFMHMPVNFPFLDQSLAEISPNKDVSVKVPAQEKTLVPEESILEIPDFSPTTQNVGKSVFFVPSVREIIPGTQEIASPKNNDESLEHVEIPATQDISMNQNDILEVPPFTDSTLKQLDNLEIPTLTKETSINKSGGNEKDTFSKTLENVVALEKSAIKSLVLNDSKPKDLSAKNLENFEVPDLQNLSIKDTEEIEIPATQELSHVEIPATQDLEIPETQEIEASQKMEAPKSAFSVYEDSVCVVPSLIVKAPVSSNQSQANISRKENLMVPSANVSVKRTVSDEFLALCAQSPQVGGKKPVAEPAREISDLLKFSDIKSKSSLETSFGDLQINKSPSPTMNILEADLNTERFNMPLHFGKNSTIIGEVVKVSPVPKVPSIESFDLSIEMDEEETKRLGTSGAPFIPENKNENVFKVPMMPPPPKPVEPPKPAVNQQFEIFEDEKEEEEEDLSKSIYHQNNKKDMTVFENENEDTWEDEKMCSFIANEVNRYEYTMVQDFEDSVSFKLREAIAKSNGNPFGRSLRALILEQCNFEQYLENHVDTCKMLKNVPQLKTGSTLECGKDNYRVLKLLAKGGFGAVYEVRNLRNNTSYAAKQEKPANMWEYYILIELQSRLTAKKITHMIPAYMQVYESIIANNASVLISEFSQFGTIIDVCNKIKNITGKNVDEYIGMIFATQMLSIIDYLHSCHIIHADVKPDNFLLMSKIEMGMKTPALQLIDFGTAIDMESFESNDKFTYVVKTENFTCCEMLEKKPWTYQTDLFGLCGTVHVILFGKYMEVEKKLNNWQIKTRFPRYFQKYLWDIFFNTLLNVPDCKTMPNLQNLKQQFDEEIHSRQKYILDKVNEFNNALLS